MYKIEFASNVKYQKTGIVGFQAGAAAVQLSYYNGKSTLIPYVAFKSMDIQQMTEEEITNCGDDAYVAWYTDMKVKAEEKAAAEKEKAALAAVAEVDEGGV